MPNYLLCKIFPAAVFAFALCLTTAVFAEDKAAAAEKTSGGAMPLVLPEQTNPEILKAQDRLYRLTLGEAHYLLTLVHPWTADPSLKLTTSSKSNEQAIRPNCGAVATFAFLYRFGPYDEKIVGVSRKDLLEQTIIPMARYITATHITGTYPTSDKNKWGNAWQSALWAAMLARGTWWIWDDLPDDLHQSIRQIVVYEAKRFIGQDPPHNINHDTKSEENAWNSQIFNAAILLMPSDPARPVWEKEFQRWTMSSYLRPADEHSQKIVDGRPVSEQFTGANIYNDFTLENHDIVHPDYMGAFTLTLTGILDCELSGRKPPEALLHNAAGLYANMKWFYLPDCGCAYPNGEDWPLFGSPFDWIELHAPMAAYASDTDAFSLLKRCLTNGEKMQARDPRGGIYDNQEVPSEGFQQGLGEILARTWLTLQTAKQIVDKPQPPLGVNRLDNGKLIIHRTPNAIHTFSWGPVVMAQCLPWRLDRVVSPDQRNGVGYIRLKNEKKILPVKLVSAEVKDSADGFTADVTLDHGNAVRAELQFRSNADGTLGIREKLTALKDITTSELNTGSFGILNNPHWIYETHSRKIKLGDVTTDVSALSGITVKNEAAQQIDIDGALKIESPAPLSARYQGTKKIDRGRATDNLYLNSLEGDRDWKKDQVISTFEATIAPQTNP